MCGFCFFSETYLEKREEKNITSSDMCSLEKYIRELIDILVCPRGVMDACLSSKERGLCGFESHRGYFFLISRPLDYSYYYSYVNKSTITNIAMRFAN